MNSSTSSFRPEPTPPIMRKAAMVWLLILLACTGILIERFWHSDQPAIETNILALLPKNQQDLAAQQAFDQVANSLSNKVVFLLAIDDANNVATEAGQTPLFLAADQFASGLNSLGLFGPVSAQISSAQQAAWYQFYYNNRGQLLTAQQQTQLKQAPQQQTQYVIQSLYNPFSGVTGQELLSDPFLLFRDYLANLSQLAGEFQLDQGYLTKQVQTEQYLLIVADLQGSPYQADVQSKLPLLEQLEQQLEQRYKLAVLHSGVLFYAAYGTESAKSEISTIGVGSLLGVILLLLMVYRSALPLMLSLLSIACGFIAALAGCLLIFHKVHLFSLVFGTSLIGVSIDYAFHYLTERLALGQRWHALTGIKKIFNAITLGLITSLIGYLGLLIAPFPGLQQLALFSAIGLAGAYFTVLFWYPLLAKRPERDRPLPADVLWQWWLNLWHWRPVALGLPSLITLIACLGIFGIQYNDDIRQLQAAPTALKQQELRIQQLSGLDNSQQMLLVSAPTEQALMERLEQLSTTLDIWQRDGLIGRYQSLAQYLPSIRQQQNNFNLIESLYQSQSLPLQAALGFEQPITFSASFQPVGIKEFLDSDSSAATGFMWLGDIEGKPHSVILLSQMQRNETISQWVHQQADISLLDKSAEVSRLFADYRVKITELLAIAVVAIWGLLGWRYGLIQGSKMVLPPFIACLFALVTTRFIGSPINLFNLLALPLVLGIGIDYTLFFAEPKQHKTTQLAITLSALTTSLSFGLLAMSNTFAIHSFGLTVLVGIFVAWLLSPLAINKQPTKEIPHD